MKTYSEFRTTEFDCAGLGCEDRQDWLVGPCGTNRDAGALARANWRSLIAALKEVDPEGTDHEEYRFGHWGPGWFEIVLVRPNTKAAEVAESIENGLADHPVVDDSAYSEEEAEDAQSTWQWWGTSERIEHINLCNKQFGENISIFAARRDEVPSRMHSYMREHS